MTPARTGLGRRRRVYEPAPEPGTGGGSEGFSCCAGFDSGAGAGPLSSSTCVALLPVSLWGPSQEHEHLSGCPAVTPRPQVYPHEGNHIPV